MPSVRSEEHLQRATGDITRLLEKHRVLTTLARRQEGPRRDLVESLQHRQNLVELHKRLRLMHSADVAFVLEALPQDDRRTVWEQLTFEHAGQVLVELSDAVRESLVAITPAAPGAQLDAIERALKERLQPTASSFGIRVPRRHGG